MNSKSWDPPVYNQVSQYNRPKCSLLYVCLSEWKCVQLRFLCLYIHKVMWGEMLWRQSMSHTLNSNRHDVAVTRAERIKDAISMLSCSFWRAAFSGNVEVNNNLARYPLFSHWSGIFGAHINRLHHELAACWNNGVHLCPIILWLAAGRLNHTKSWRHTSEDRDTKDATCESDADGQLYLYNLGILLKLYRDAGQNNEMYWNWMSRFVVHFRVKTF